MNFSKAVCPNNSWKRWSYEGQRILFKIYHVFLKRLYLTQTFDREEGQQFKGNLGHKVSLGTV